MKPESDLKLHQWLPRPNLEVVVVVLCKVVVLASSHKFVPASFAAFNLVMACSVPVLLKSIKFWVCSLLTLALLFTFPAPSQQALKRDITTRSSACLQYVRSHARQRSQGGARDLLAAWFRFQ